MRSTQNGTEEKNVFEKADGLNVECATDRAPARQEFESELIEIWQSVLCRERVRVHDNFFDLGGHSLSALAMCAQIARRINLAVPLRWVFEEPTIDRLARKLIMAAGAMEEAAPISRADRQAPIHISFAQQPLWLMSLMYPAQAAYNLPRLLRLTGPLSVSALQKSLDELMRRHEVLRTTFAPGEDLPEQRIALNCVVSIPIVDLQALPSKSREAEALRQASEEAGRPFDLGQGPLLRASLWRLAPEAHWLSLILHHSVMDGASFRFLFLELSVLYAAHIEGKSPRLPELPIQYADFADWQRRRLRGETIQSQLAYWRQQLVGAPPQLDLSTDFPHPAVQTFCGRRRSAVFPPSAAAQLQAFSRTEGATVFMTLLAAFQTILHRHTGQSDLVVGTPIANRDRAEFEGMIGNFLNTLPLRADLSGDPTFREFLHRTRSVTIDALAHRDVPWQVLLDSVPFPRAPGRTPLFQVVFNFLSYEEAVPELQQLQVVECFPPEAPALFDLELYARESFEGLKFALIGNSDLYTEETLDDLLGHLLTLLTEVVADPDQRLSRVPLLTERQRQQAVAHIRGALPTNPFLQFAAADIEQSIPSRFEHQAALHSGKLAIATPHHQWTYDALNAASNRIAHRLLKLPGTGPHRIALLYEHGAPMVAVLLGVLKAGMAYLPLDPLNPEARLSRILEDAQVSALLTSPGLLLLAESIAPPTLLMLTSSGEEDPDIPIVNPRRALAPDTMAYLLYTSGSTGQPKAVMQNHRNVLHFTRTYTNALHLTPDDRLSLFPTYGFDAAVMDIFGALLNGASLHLRNVRETTAPEIIEFLRVEAVTVYHSTPTLYRHLVNSLEPGGSLSSVRFVVLGGEAVTRADVELHRLHFTPGCLLVNGFGPTECTVAAQFFISHRTPLRGTRVPVGHPVEGTEIFLLDETGDERGVVGEIALRSPHSALGYWCQPEVTRAMFYSDPADKSCFVFRTGDLGLRRPDGMLEVLGRKDFQVKVRGYRVELGEIEAALRELPDVEEAVVIKRDDLPNDQLLAGYVCLADHTYWTAETLRHQLRRRLPEYMVPADIVILDEMPLLSNGKLNRRALPTPPAPRESASEPREAPVDLLELKLLEIWRRLLGRRSIGRDDNFFDLGGHSLLATRVVTEIEKLLGYKMPIAALFQSPTIEALARQLTDNNWSPRWSALVPLQPLGNRPPIFFVHGWGGDVYVFLELAKLMGPDQPCYGIQAVGLNGRDKPHISIEEMAAHYVQEIVSFQAIGPYHLSGYSIGGLIAFEVAQQLHRIGKKVGVLALLDTRPGRPAMAPYLASRFIFHVKRYWRMPNNERLDYFRGRIAALPWLTSRNRSNPSMLAAPPKPSLLPQIPGFADYYQAVAWWYRLRRYPGSANVFLSDDALPSWVNSWRRLVRGGLSVHRVPGTHHHMLSPNNLPMLENSLRALVRRPHH